jgi:hypothetical protein
MADNNGIYDLKNPAPFLHFGALFEGQKYNGKGDPKFGGEFVFPADHPDLQPLKDKAISVAKAEWPGVELATVGWPFKSGDKRAKERAEKGKDGKFYAGKAVLKSRSKYAIMVSWFDNGKIVEVASDDAVAKANSSKFFNGSECLASFNFTPVVVDGKKYITAYLNKVFATGKGERVGGGRSAAEAFKGYVGQATTEDPTVGTVADIPMN